jgi:hypothetical protein
VQNHSKQTICSTLKGKKGPIYNRTGAKGSNSSDRGYYSFSTADAISGAYLAFFKPCYSLQHYASVHAIQCENDTPFTCSFFLNQETAREAPAAIFIIIYRNKEKREYS